MAISDSDFAAWLAKDTARVILYEQQFAYESGGVPVEGTRYFCSMPYTTQPTDSPPNQPYQSRLRKAPKLAISINPDTVSGITAISVDSVILDNADGGIDSLLKNIILGRAAKFYLGDASWARSDFRLVSVLYAEAAIANGDNQIEVAMRDARMLLNRAIAGDSVNDSRRKPLVFCAAGGVARSIEPVEKDPNALLYYYLQNLTNGLIYAVYDNGAPLTSGVIFSATNAALTANAGTDTLTYAGHGLAVNDVVFFGGGGTIFAGLALGIQYWVIASGLTANDFKLSTTRGGGAIDITGTTFTGTATVTRQRYYDNFDGTLQLSAAAAGRLTVDVIGHSASQDAGKSVGELIRAMLVDYGGIPSASINLASFLADYNGLAVPSQAAARAVLDRENLIAVLDDLAQVTQLFYGPDYQGTFRAGRLALGSLAAATATRTLTAADVLAAPSVVNARVITGTVAVDSFKNYQPLTYGEMAGSVSVATRRALSAPFQVQRESTAPSGTSYASNWQGFFQTAIRDEIGQAFATTSSDSGSLADAILGDRKPQIQMLQVATDLRAYSWLLGDVVSFTYPRYGFDAGKNCKVISIETDLMAERVTLGLITQTTPDTTTSDYS